MTRLPWLGFYSPDGRLHSKTWVGPARHVIVTNVRGEPWHPSDGVPVWAEVFEVREQPFGEVLQKAEDLRGIIVLVCDTFPVQQRSV